MSESDTEYLLEKSSASSEIDWSLFDVIYSDDWQQEEAIVIAKSTEVDWSVFFPPERRIEEDHEEGSTD